jgi:hypothetical protein
MVLLFHLVPITQRRLGAIISGPHKHRVQKLLQVVEEAATVCKAASLGELPGVGLQLRDLGIPDIVEARTVDIVLLQSTAETMKGPAADAENRQRLPHSVIVALINFGVEIRLVLFGGCLLVEPVKMSDLIQHFISQLLCTT